MNGSLSVSEEFYITLMPSLVLIGSTKLPKQRGFLLMMKKNGNMRNHFQVWYIQYKMLQLFNLTVLT